MSVRRVLVLGATGGTGRHVVRQAAAMNLEVTTLVRSPGKLPATDRPLRVVTGDIRTDSSTVRAAYAVRTRSFLYLASVSHSHQAGSSPTSPLQ